MWYTTSVLFLFSFHIIQIDELTRVFSSFYPSRKKHVSHLSRLTKSSSNKPLSGMLRETTAVVKTLPLMLKLSFNNFRQQHAFVAAVGINVLLSAECRHSCMEKLSINRKHFKLFRLTSHDNSNGFQFNVRPFSLLLK